MACAHDPAHDPVVTIQQASPDACNNMQMQPVTMCQDGMGQYVTLDVPTQVLQEQQPGLELTSAQIQVLIDSMQSVSVNAGLSSVPGMVVVDNSGSSVSGALSMPQLTMQGTDLSASTPMILQLQMPAPTQCVQQTLAVPETSMQYMQPVYATLQGQQVVLVNGPAVNGTMQPQMAACAGTVVSDSSGSAVQVQLQQLQNAVQQLSSQTAAVQQMLLTAQHTQDTTNSATGCVQCVTTPAGMPGQTIILLDPSSGQMTTGVVSNSSQETTSVRQDSSSGSWQCSDSTSTPLKTPVYTTVCTGDSGMSGMTLSVSASGPSSTPGAAQGNSAAQTMIISGPQMPQPANGPMPPQMIMQSPNAPNHMQHVQHVQMQMSGVDGSNSGTAGQYNTGMGPERPMLMPAHAYSPHSSHGSGYPAPPAPQHGYKGQHGGYPLKQGHHMHHMQHHRPGHMQSAGYLSHRGGRGSYGNSNRGAHAARPGRATGSIQSVSASSGKPAGTGAFFASTPGAQQGSPASAKAQGGASDSADAAASAPARGINTAYASVPVEEGLGSLWSVEKLQASKGGRLYNVQQLAWLPVGDPEPAAQDLYNFQKLKRVVQKLDAVHKNRVKLIKRIHGVADPGYGDLKDVYREVRSLIGELLHEGSMRLRSLQETGVAGLVRLALLLQDALEQGPKEGPHEDPVIM